MIAYLGAGGRQSNVLLVTFKDWRISMITIVIGGSFRKKM